MSNISAILEKQDKEVILKWLITENKDNFAMEGIDTDIYVPKFKERNGIGLVEIEKNLTEQGLTEVNESDVDKVFSLIKISKAFDVSQATEGIIYSLQILLNDLYWDSKYLLNRFTENLDNADLIREINLFLFYVKMVKDDLKFITFVNGQISTVPITQTISKCGDCYEDHYYDNPKQVNEYDIREVNRIKKSLGISVNLLGSLLSIFPENPDFDFFKTILETTLKVITDFNNHFADIVILANSLDIIRVTPKSVIPKETPVVFYNSVGKSQTVAKQKLPMQILKSDIEGRVTMLIYEPETLDADGNFASKEVIAKGRDKFMLDYQQFDIMHNLKVLKSEKGEGRQVALIESYITKQSETIGERVVKEGAWIMELQYFDKDIISKITKGELTGPSLYGEAIIDPDDLTPKAA